MGLDIQRIAAVRNDLGSMLGSIAHTEDAALPNPPEVFNKTFAIAARSENRAWARDHLRAAASAGRDALAGANALGAPFEHATTVLNRYVDDVGNAAERWNTLSSRIHVLNTPERGRLTKLHEGLASARAGATGIEERSNGTWVLPTIPRTEQQLLHDRISDFGGTIDDARTALDSVLAKPVSEWEHVDYELLLDVWKLDTGNQLRLPWDMRLSGMGLHTKPGETPLGAVAVLQHNLQLWKEWDAAGRTGESPLFRFDLWSDGGKHS